MADLFSKETDNVLDVVNQQGEFADEFQGGFFDDAESDFLGIAIGKKARARQAAKRADRQAGRKYRLETKRIRALQGQPDDTGGIVKTIAGGVTSLAGAFLGGGLAGNLGGDNQQQIDDTGQQEAYALQMATMQKQQNGANYIEPKAKNNTVLYVIIGLAVITGAFFLLRKK